jgi:UDP-N-acetylglucosamine 1-carboxyvinyltransferase
VDIHLAALEQLGAQLRLEHGYIVAEAKNGLRGAEVYMGGSMGSTVTGTANVLMAATLARGTTHLVHAACEPEIVDLANFLTAMGAKIEGAGTAEIRVEGVSELKTADHRIMPDRIEAATFLFAPVIATGKVTVAGIQPGHLVASIRLIEQMGGRVTRTADSVTVECDGRARAAEVTTLPYPGFPTDVQAVAMTAMASADGISVLTEKVYPDRFMHISELNRMGARIRKEGPTAIISGVERLSGAPVMGSDLRAAAALVMGGLGASGTTEVRRIYHLDRGYEAFDQRLRDLGGDVRRVKDEQPAYKRFSD